MEPCAIIDPRLSGKIVKNIHSAGFKTIPAPLTGLVAPPLSGHPDIQMFLHGDNLFVHPEIDLLFLKAMEKYVNIIRCQTPLSGVYPGDIPYNIACTGRLAIHRTESTEQKILEYFRQNNIEIIETKQGYSKCSTMIVDDQSIVTSDRSIHSAAEKAGLDALLISPGHIDLPGYSYGFIGGASGKFLNRIYLTGSIDGHPDCGRIIEFISSKGCGIKILSDERIFDGGSIFFIG
jgi:hypothetical protein